MNRVEQNMSEEISGQKVFNAMKALSLQKAITVTALLLLIIAVQVSTQSAADWFVFGLNVLEVTAPFHVSVNETSNVSAGFVSGLHHLSDMVWTSATALIELIFR